MKKLLNLSLPALLLAAGGASAEYGRLPDNYIDPSVVRIDEEAHLGAPVDGSYALIDSSGKEFTLGDLYGKPVVLVLSYFSCDGSCPASNRRLKEILSGVRRATPGTDFSVLTVSFDGRDTAEKIPMFEEMAGLSVGPVPGWRVAVMKRNEDAEALAKGVGFKYFWSESDRTFVHSNVYVVLAPGGRVARYLYGAVAEPLDLEVALAEASLGKASSSKIRDLSDMLLMACYSYNFKEGRYTVNYPLFIAAGSVALGLALILASIIVFKKKSRR